MGPTVEFIFFLCLFKMLPFFTMYQVKTQNKTNLRTNGIGKAGFQGGEGYSPLI